MDVTLSSRLVFDPFSSIAIARWREAQMYGDDPPPDKPEGYMIVIVDGREVARLFGSALVYYGKTVELRDLTPAESALPLLDMKDHITVTLSDGREMKFSLSSLAFSIKPLKQKKIES